MPRPALAPVVALVLAASHLPATPAQTLDCLHSAGSPCPHAGYDVVSAVVDDQLFVFGGFFGPQVLATRRLDRYDPQSDSWRSVADLPVAVTHAPAVVVGREVWVLGGFVGDHPGVISDAVWRYDVDFDTWAPGPPLPQAVAAGAGARLGTRVHYFGGLQPDRDTGSPAHFAFDVAQPALGWVRLADLPMPRNHMSGVAWQGFLWAIGGQERHDTSPTDTDLVHVYDPVTDAWVAGPPLPFPRSHAEGATFATAAQIVLVGGRTSALGLGALNDVATLELGASGWRNLAPIPHPISGAAAAGIGGELLVTAGNDAAPAHFVEVHRRDLAAAVTPAFRTNCGGGAYTGAATWCADLGAEPGPTVSAPIGVDVLGTDEDALFRDQRLGGGGPDPTRLRYRLASAPGPVRVRLHFAELWHTTAGARVFDVRVQGRLLDPTVDVVALAGAGTALALTYDVDAPFGVVDVELAGWVDLPALAAVEVLALAAPHLERHCVGQASGTGVVMRLELVGSGSLGAGRGDVLGVGPVPGTLGVLFRGDGVQALATPIGVVCVGPLVQRIGVAAGGPHGLRFPLDLGVGAMVPFAPGDVWRFQCWYRDGVGAGLSDALTLVFTP